MFAFLYVFVFQSSEPTELRVSALRGVPCAHWKALVTFAYHTSSDRDALHGAVGKGREGEPSPFTGLAGFAGGWRYLKLWDLKAADDRAIVLDAGGRALIPSECFSFFIYAAALDTYAKHERLDGRISPAAVMDTLVTAKISAGAALGAKGGRPPIFSISVSDILTVLGADVDGSAGAASSNAACTVDAALNNLAAARNIIVNNPQLRRFLSLVPPSWPTTANDAAVIDEFKDGRRQSLIFNGASLVYLRHKIESLAGESRKMPTATTLCTLWSAWSAAALYVAWESSRREIHSGPDTRTSMMKHVQ
jgi:hypothetical protein